MYKCPAGCKTCGKEFSMKAYLQQHMQGAHMGGWRAACGEVKKWPKQLHKHEDSCKKCAGVELKRTLNLLK